MKRKTLVASLAVASALIGASAFAAVGGTNSGGNTEVIAWTNYAHAPSGQSYTIRARAGNLGTDELLIVNKTTGATIATGQEGVGSVTASTRAVVSSATTEEYVAELYNPSTGSVDASSAPVDVRVIDTTGNGSNMGYENNTNGIMAMALTGLNAPQDTQNPDLYVGWENIQGTPVDQFWIGNTSSSKGTAFEDGWGGIYADDINPSFSGQPIGYGPSGKWFVTSYVEEDGQPDSKPYLAKSHTIWFYSDTPSNSSLSFSTQNPSQGSSVEIVAPSGYSNYQVWVSPQDGTGRWNSFQTSSNDLYFTPTQMGGWEIVVDAGGKSWTGYLNVNQ